MKPLPSAPFTQPVRLNMTEDDCVMSHGVTLPMVQGRETPRGNKMVLSKSFELGCAPEWIFDIDLSLRGTAIQSVMSSGDALTPGKTGGVGSAIFNLHDNGTLDYQVIRALHNKKRIHLLVTSFFYHYYLLAIITIIILMYYYYYTSII